MLERMKKCAQSIRNKTDFVPEIGIILGSGLGELADEIDAVATVNYGEIEGFPISTAPGHKGRFVFGYIGEKKVVVMQGRVHYYEGYSMQEVVMPTRIMGMLGIKKLILTNAAGGINTDFSKGALMIITDHITDFVPSPLIGKNIDELGVRFPDMTDVYSPRCREIIKKCSEKCNIDVKEGVYIQLTGPNYETPAEIRMCKLLGGDAVGMSTACEAMAARHMGIEVCGISCITNMAAGISKEKLSHAEVQETADRVAGEFKALVRAVTESI